MYLADYHTHSRMSPDAATPMADMARAATAAGMDAHVSKPIDFQILCKTLEELTLKKKQ